MFQIKFHVSNIFSATLHQCNGVTDTEKTQSGFRKMYGDSV